MKDKKSLVAVIIFVLIIAFIATFMDSIFLYTFDSAMYNEIIKRMSPNLTLVMKYITDFGSTLMVIILCFCLFLFEKTRKNWAPRITLAVIVSAILNNVIKIIFARERPDLLQLVTESTYSFPSGHAMVNMSFYMMIILLARKYIKDFKFKISIAVICLLLPLTIGISRIYLGVHYATDVIAGWILGTCVSVVVYYSLEHRDNMKKRGKDEKIS